jgi:5-methylcytosine-specific restriction endonuclease McrA
LVSPCHLKIDPGSQITGLAIVNDADGEVVWAAELTHRGKQIKKRLDDRRCVRRGRRQRHTRYRPACWRNRRRPKGWLAPSLHSRVNNILTWMQRLKRYCPIMTLSFELVKFDIQALVNPEIEGAEYQQGTLFGYELREYLLEKWGRQCVYCHKTDIPLQIEHLVPKSRGGSNRVTNLGLACGKCNDKKGTRTATEFGFPDLMQQAQKPLKDAATMNSIRWHLHEKLRATGLPVEIGTGGRTKWNRATRGIPKTHWLDAACVGASTPERLHWTHTVPLLIQAVGRHSRQMCLMDKHGFPRTKRKGPSVAFGFQSGDMVKAVVPDGKPKGVHVGKVTIKTRGLFTITTAARTVPDVPYRYCRRLHRSDGYTYQKGKGTTLPPYA